MNNVLKDAKRRKLMIKDVRSKIKTRKAKHSVLRTVTYSIAVIAIGLVSQLGSTEAKTEDAIRTVEVIEVIEVDDRNIINATVTAYTSSVDETDDTPFETASGERTKDGVLACPPKYKFGTNVIIKNKVFVCEDRMNRRYHNQERFDMWVETKAEAFDWGVQNLQVEVIK